MASPMARSWPSSIWRAWASSPSDTRSPFAARAAKRAASRRSSAPKQSKAAVSSRWAETSARWTKRSSSGVISGTGSFRAFVRRPSNAPYSRIAASRSCASLACSSASVAAQPRPALHSSMRRALRARESASRTRSRGETSGARSLLTAARAPAPSSAVTDVAGGDRSRPAKRRRSTSSTMARRSSTAVSAKAVSRSYPSRAEAGGEGSRSAGSSGNAAAAAARRERKGARSDNGGDRRLLRGESVMDAGRRPIERGGSGADVQPRERMHSSGGSSRRSDICDARVSPVA
mmetsp:Transcript_35562/g.118897  ORF Transcript_35562/g.118897 Transcript_35562/m.118897 type:complete len:290 (-) Transcript_35562:74-943(-)